MTEALKKCYPIHKRDFVHAGEAAINVKNLLKSMGVNEAVVRKVAICGYEGEMNVVMHGGDGQLCLEIDVDKIVIVISDNGPGINNIDLAMTRGFSTATEEYREMGFGAGMGLPNMNKNADRFDISSRPNEETRLTMEFFLTD